MQLEATTVGDGPFSPAIKWQDNDGNTRVWRQPSRHEKEDDAVAVAKKVLTVVGDAINEELTRESFQPE